MDNEDFADTLCSKRKDMNLISTIKKKIGGSPEAKASSAYMLCSVVQKCLSFITLPLFTRILSTEDFGVGTVYLSTSAIVIIFVTLNLPYGSFSPAMLRFEKDRDGYISATNMISVLLTGVYFLVYFLFRDFWNDLLDLPTELMVLMGGEMLAGTAIQFWMGKARFEYKYKGVVWVTILLSVIGTASSFVAVLLFSNKGTAKVLANGIVVCIIGGVILIRALLKGKKCFAPEYWKYALAFNIPLIPYYLSQIVFNQSDRLMIDRMVGRGEAALYGVAYTVAFVLTFALNAVNNSFIPWMYRSIKTNRLKEIRKNSLVIATAFSILLLGIIALAPELILVLGGSKYEAAVDVVPPVAMSLLLLFYSQLFINVEFYFEEKYKLVGASILAAVANIVLNYFGIREFGFVAAGYTTLISYVLFAGCNYIFVRKICLAKGMEEPLYYYKGLLAVFVVFAVIGFGVAAMYPFRILRLMIILTGAVILLCERKHVISFVSKTFGLASK